MKKLLATICAGAVLGLMASCDDAPGKAKAYNQGINIIPTPVSLTQNEGNFKLNKNTKIYASTPEAKTVAEFFAAKMNTATGYQIATADKETSDGISLVIDGSLDVNDEGYTLDVADSGVRIKAKTPQGLFYGMQSFLQLLPAEIESPSAVKGIAWTAPAVSIKDEPRFGYRGIMLDPCRHFIPVENIKKQLDVLALFKINRVHWHLTDDQGWRIEIKKYPKLTEIGSKRIDGEGTEYGGFYTQEEVIAPEKGLLACRDIGDGKMPSEDVLVGHILREIAHEKDLAGMKVIVTAGPTQESVDPVRYITNHSTGKMGYELAKAAMLRGAEVTLVSGVTNLEPPMFVDYVQVKSAGDMFEAMKSRFLDNDIIIKAAAVADYKPKSYSDEKTKKKDGEMSIELDRTQDILKYLGEHRREGQFYCGFSMETQNMLENSRVKLDKKNIDMVVANNLKIAGSGFGTDTNVVTMISKEEEIQLELLSKAEVAHKILDEILKLKAIKG